MRRTHLNSISIDISTFGLVGISPASDTSEGSKGKAAILRGCAVDQDQRQLALRIHQRHSQAAAARLEIDAIKGIKIQEHDGEHTPPSRRPDNRRRPRRLDGRPHASAAASYRGGLQFRSLSQRFRQPYPYRHYLGSQGPRRVSSRGEEQHRLRVRDHHFPRCRGGNTTKDRRRFLRGNGHRGQAVDREEGGSSDGRERHLPGYRRLR